MLLDRDSFTEHLAFASGSGGEAGDGVIVGYGTISGRLVCVYAQDFTVSGGSLGAMHAKKYVRLWTWPTTCKHRSLP